MRSMLYPRAAAQPHTEKGVPLMARVLVIDDDPNILRNVTEILEDEGHEVLQAGGGKSALDLIEQREPDLIVSDVYMPDMDGIELLIRLQTERPEIPVVAVSGGGHMPKEELLGNASMLGAVAVLEKPFTVEGLIEVVNRALEGFADDGDE